MDTTKVNMSKAKRQFSGVADEQATKKQRSATEAPCALISDADSSSSDSECDRDVMFTDYHALSQHLDTLDEPKIPYDECQSSINLLDVLSCEAKENNKPIPDVENWLSHCDECKFEDERVFKIQKEFHGRTDASFIPHQTGNHPLEGIELRNVDTRSQHNNNDPILDYGGYSIVPYGF